MQIEATFESIWNNQNQTALTYLTSEEQRKHLSIAIGIEGIETELEKLYREYPELLEEKPDFIPPMQADDGSIISVKEYENQLQEKYSSYGKEAATLMRKARDAYTAALRENPEYLYSEAKRLTDLLTFESLEDTIEVTAFFNHACKQDPAVVNPNLPEWAYDFRSDSFMFHEAIQSIYLPLKAYISNYPDLYTWNIYVDYFAEPPEYIGPIGQEPELGVKLRKLYNNKGQELTIAAQDYELQFDFYRDISYKKPKHSRRKPPTEDVMPISKSLYITTAYKQDIFTFNDLADSHIIPLDPTKVYTHSNNKLFEVSHDDEKGDILIPVNSSELRDMKTKKHLSCLVFEKPVLPLLLASINDYYKDNKQIPEVIAFRITDYLRAVGLPTNLTKEKEKAVLDEMKKYQTVEGIIKDGSRESEYAVFLFHSYDAASGVIRIASPYIVEQLSRLHNVAIARNKDNSPKLTKNGTPKMLPTGTRLVKSTIYKDKNPVAITLTCHLVSMIEKAGHTGISVRVSKLMNDIPQLKEGYERTDPSNRSRFLKRVFTKTYELLRTETLLSEKYEDIQIPDPNNPKYIPTPRTLDMIVVITHKGTKANNKRT